MMAQTAVPFVDTTIIPDRNAGIGSLLWDLQAAQDPEHNALPLLGPEFAFIDVGVSRASVASSLKNLLSDELRMDVDYVATERHGMVPYAYVTLLGEKVKKIQRYLSAVISSKETTREVTDWHYVVDIEGKASSIAYSYNHMGNKVWESYFMGRAFMNSGETVEYSDPLLNELLAPDAQQIEAMIDLERKRECDPGHPAPSWDGYRLEKNPLEQGLADHGISLQKTDVPQRIPYRQNVLFLGNVLDHYPRDEQCRGLDRIAANMQAGDIVIVQLDDMEASYVEVLLVKGQGVGKTRERARWIDTSKLEIHKPAPDSGPWQKIQLKPVLQKIRCQLINCIWGNETFPDSSREQHKILAHQCLHHVLATHFRALPVEETLRIAIREALLRLPSAGRPRGITVFNAGTNDASGDVLEMDTIPFVSDLIRAVLAEINSPNNVVEHELRPYQAIHVGGKNP